MEKQFNLIIDTKRTGFNAVRGFKQEENNSVLYISLVQNSVPFDLTGLTVRINFKRPDGQVLLQMADITSPTEGKIKVNILTRVLKLVGEVKADLSIFNKENEKITSASFSMFVDAPIYTNDYILGNDEFDIIQKIWVTEDERIKAENTRKSNEENRIENESIREKNEKDRTDKEQLRELVEDRRQDNEAGREKNEATRIENEKIRATNESKRIENEENRVTKESERVEAEEERKINESARINNETQRATKEEERKLNEKQRLENEEVRKSNENSRIQEENKRLENEDVRKDNEITRQNNEIVRESNENKRQDSENIRQNNENDRAKEWDLIKDSYLEKNIGDMKKLTYDKNNNGIVDKAESITDGSITYTATDIKDIIDNSNNIERKTYEELTQLIADNKLETGSIYLLTDYQTKYRILRTDEWCVGKAEELYLTATSTNALSPIAYSKQYPQDIIYYDVTLNEIEGQQRTGFIIRRIDTKKNNATPFDFRTAQWARFRLHYTEYKYNNTQIPYDKYTQGEEVEEGRLYLEGSKLYIAYRTGTPENIEDKNYLEALIDDIYKFRLEDYTGMYVYKLKTQIIGDKTQLDLYNTFSDKSTDNILEGFNNPSSCVFIDSVNNQVGASCSRLTFDNANSNTLGTSCTNIIMQGSFSNVLDRVVTNTMLLNGCYYNHISESSQHILINVGGSFNDIGSNCSTINLISNCKSIQIGQKCNIIVVGYFCHKIRLGSYCVDTSFGAQCHAINIGAECEMNTFGDRCAYIALGDSCSMNTLAPNCSTIELNTNCDLNKFQYNCGRIELEVGCSANTFAQGCYYITVGITSAQNEFGELCRNIRFGNGCRDNKLQNEVMHTTLTNNCIGNTIGQGCQNIHCLGNMVNCKIGNELYQTFIYKLVDKDITTISDLYNKSHTITIKQCSNGQYVYSYINKSMGYETSINPIP
ncbi:BppU family phage baseplate upper protein [Clostridium sporogenes]